MLQPIGVTMLVALYVLSDTDGVSSRAIIYALVSFITTLLGSIAVMGRHIAKVSSKHQAKLEELYEARISDLKEAHSLVDTLLKVVEKKLGGA